MSALRLQTLSRAQTAALGAIGLLSFLGVWSFLSLSGIVPHQFLPAPHEVAARFFQLLFAPFAGATLQEHLASSALRFAYGFGLGAVVGIPLGLLMGWFRVLDEIVSPMFDGLRFIAPIAWVPFAALWFGTGIGGPILIIFAGAFPQLRSLGPGRPGIDGAPDATARVYCPERTNGGCILDLHNGRFITLAVPGASMTQAFGVNDRDEVVGAYTTGSGNNAATHGFTWRPGYGFRTVDDPHGLGATTINGVNDAGDLVGFYTDSAGNTDGMLALP